MSNSGKNHNVTLSCSPEIDSINTLTPDSHGGNMDLPDMGPGSITYLPVRTEGGRLFIGDAPACQGDGEVCGTAVEFASTTTIQVDLIKGIGRAIANTLAAEGAHVAFCARNADEVAQTVKDFAGHGVKISGRVVDGALTQGVQL